MMARGFKPVGWVAGVAAAALGCYMLSLNVASERAELAKLERSIIAAKRDIRTLQTEFGTRGRLQQLESWNANVLALSAPTSAQFLDNELTLARFEQREQSIEERSSSVHMAAAPAVEAPKVRQKVEAPVRYASAPTAEKPASSLVHQAGLMVGDAKPVAPVKVAAVAKPLSLAKKAEPAKAEPAKAEEKKASPAKTATAEKKAAATKPAEFGKKSGGEKVAKKEDSKTGKAGSAGGQ